MRFASENGADDASVSFGIAAGKVVQCGRAQWQIGWAESGGGEAAVLVKFRDGVVAERGEFIHATVSGAAAHHHSACDAEALQHLGHRFGELSARDTNELGSRLGGVEQRA